MTDPTDFGFFSWPEPGVGAYSEVRDTALAFEQRLGLEYNGTDVTTSNWDKKTRKLFWRGVPMVQIRQVRLQFSIGLVVSLSLSLPRRSLCLPLPAARSTRS